MAAVSGKFAVATTFGLGAQILPASGPETEIPYGTDQHGRPIYQLQIGAKSGREFWAIWKYFRKYFPAHRQAYGSARQVM